jgi:lysophospholipase L1-like esterase
VVSARVTAPAAERPQYVFAALALVLLAAVVAVGLEIYVRLIIDDGLHFDLEMWKYAREVKQVSADPILGHEHRPGAAAHLMGVDVRINRLKLRDAEYPYQRPPGVQRVLMLGDSVTFGWGVPVADTVAKRLERKLRDAGRGVEVINTGVGNYNTIMEVEYFFNEGARYDPQVVVLNYFINDAEPVPTYRAPNLLQRHSYAWVWLSGRLDVLARLLARRQDFADYYLALYDAPGWTAAQQSIARLTAHCRERGIAVLIANYPELRELKPYRFDRVRAVVRETAERNGAAYLDLYDAVRDENPERLWVTKPDDHPSSYAHGLFADAMVAPVSLMLDRQTAR